MGSTLINTLPHLIGVTGLKTGISTAASTALHTKALDIAAGTAAVSSFEVAETPRSDIIFTTGRGNAVRAPNMVSKSDRNWHEDVDAWEKLSGVIFRNERMMRTPQEVDSIIQLLNLKSGDPILDLCCGIGRHSLELARRGYRMTGVDSNPAFLDRARNKADQEGLAVEWILDDMRRFEQPGVFRAVLNLFSSFGYFIDQKDDSIALLHMFNSLQPHGKVLIECKGKEFLQSKAGTITEHRFERLHVREEIQIDDDNSWVTSHWTIVENDKEKTVDIGYRIYSGGDLSALLKSAGFADIRLFGNLAGTQYDDKSPNLVTVAEKPA